MKRKATLDFLFPLSLFTIFIIVSSILLSISIGGYRKVQAADEQQNDILISSYITNKIRSFDDGNIMMKSIDGTNCLMLNKTIQSENYTTYLYYKDDSINELLMKSNQPVDLRDGTKVLKVKDYKMELKNGMFTFYYKGIKGNEYEQKVALIGK
ncbi:MAG: DUF4860 domain-containing protein [Erysipelotrichaceae bacterium]